MQLLIKSPLTLLSTLVLSFGHVGCGTKNDRKEDHLVQKPVEMDPQGTTPEVDLAMEMEYQALPEEIILEVPMSADGELDYSKAKTRGTELDELGTSSNSWNASPQSASGLVGYDPIRQSSVNPQGSYRYVPTQTYQQDNKYVTVYTKPKCKPSDCFTASVQTTEYWGSGGTTQPPKVYVPLLDESGYLDSRLWQYLKTSGVAPLRPQDYLTGSSQQYSLGERLFHDKLISFKEDVACASCHLENRGTSNGYSIGPSGPVLAGRVTTKLTINDMLPRNAPHLFNLGHKSAQKMFWDGRVETSSQSVSGYSTPEGSKLPLGLNSALAAQALFPLVHPKEMGCGLTDSLQTLEPEEQWKKIMTKVLAKPDYRNMFSEAYPGVENFGIEHLANAIAIFQAKRWKSWNSRFDQFLAGKTTALSNEEKNGAIYFYGKGQCARCHSGPLLTDQSFHSIGMPQFGPGMGDQPSDRGDFGRSRVTNLQSDRYRFKTPSLRNVTRTGPWGHNGAFSDLKRMLHHYRDPKASLYQWSLKDIRLAPQFSVEVLGPELMTVMADPQSIESIGQSSQVKPTPLSDDEIEQIYRFLGSLEEIKP